MTIAEILKSVQFVVNPDGEKSAVMVDVDVWDEIVSMLEDIEDAEEMKQAKMIREESVPWEVVKKEMKLGE
ncbi:MAG: hypothetical protein DCC56_15430 [Anaerolineae bacterium]|nr:MAG: hypothetical protein DCC56_15430 [Anaerolineae bacterium]WKZ45604.1 MAG: hypothetical protein QY302_07410 [Anaerolineales bacterium]